MMGAMTPPSRKSCYNFRVVEINRVVDGDTIDVTIDLGFDLSKKERVRVAGVDTPEKRTRDLEEKALGIDATNWLKEKLEGAIDGEDDLVIRTELVGGMGKYGRLLGWLYIGDSTVSLNEQMIDEGYAWCYDGGTKNKDFESLREIRRSHGTLLEG
jgi:micrococcal nuclease|tara:strand:+ start:600 stop:1067 length:468 start_codon:yes stop_codon:yes gene_type:complete